MSPSICSPTCPAAAQSMWDQVAATDFDQRVTLLAAEAAAAKPDVIGLQEATIWSCRPKPWKRTGAGVRLHRAVPRGHRRGGGALRRGREGRGRRPRTRGTQIPPIPFLTTVEDPDTFQPLFGTDTADCGFVIGDALLVREDLAKDVLAVGTSEYEERYAVAPVVFEVDRGYAWADIAIAGTTVRVVTTHLESLWKGVDDGAVCRAGTPARRRPVDHHRPDSSSSATSTPIRAIRGCREARTRAASPRPGRECAAQPEPVTAANADASCSAYWTMIDAGLHRRGPRRDGPREPHLGRRGGPRGPEPRAARGLPRGGQRRRVHRSPGLRVHPQRRHAR